MCFCLPVPTSQIPRRVLRKYLIPANLTAPCAASQCSLLGAATQLYCQYTESSTVLCGRHAALHSCSHIGFLTVRTGGCCSSGEFFPPVVAQGFGLGLSQRGSLGQTGQEISLCGHSVSLWCGCSGSSVVLILSECTPLFSFLLSRFVGST